MLSESAGRQVTIYCSGLLCQALMRGTEMKGPDIHWVRSSLGVVFLDFHANSIFPRGCYCSLVAE